MVTRMDCNSEVVAGKWRENTYLCSRVPHLEGNMTGSGRIMRALHPLGESSQGTGDYKGQKSPPGLLINQTERALKKSTVHLLGSAQKTSSAIKSLYIPPNKAQERCGDHTAGLEQTRSAEVGPPRWVQSLSQSHAFLLRVGYHCLEHSHHSPPKIYKDGPDMVAQAFNSSTR